MSVLIVGAGLYGATMARELTDAGHDCVVIDRRSYVGGNVATRWCEEARCFEHRHGAHIFHTSNPAIWNYVNRFTRFRPYRHTVKAVAGGKVYSFPFNLLTLHQVYGTSTLTAARALMSADIFPCERPQNMEEYCLATIGQRLYELFVEGYTLKQWGRHPMAMPASTIKRIPLRLTYDDRYFGDDYQGLPWDGYSVLVERMLDGITIQLDRPFEHADIGKHEFVVYSGGIDEFFGGKHGWLGYRSLRFETNIEPTSDFQGGAVVNYCDERVPYTRVIEHRHFQHLDASSADRTLVTFEYPQYEGEPYYPIQIPQHQELLELYRALAKEHYPTVAFGGRLGEYRYLDMHQVIASAMAHARQLGGRLR